MQFSHKRLPFLLFLPQELSSAALLAVLPTRVAAARRLNASSHPND